MRTLIQSALLAGATLATGAPAAGAQAQPSGTNQMASMPGRAGRIERACGSAADTSLRFRRSVGDSLRTTGNVVQPPEGTRPVTGGTARSHEYPEYDVVLDIPNVCVQNIRLKVDTVTAKINLDAKVSNLVHLAAGADVFIGDVDLTIRGVRAQALLLVDLDDVYHIVDNTLTFVDNHPEIIKQLGSTLQTAGGAVGGLVGEVVGGVTGLLLGTTRDAAGNVVQRLVDQATGSIVEKTVNAAGKAVAQKAVGSVLNLPVVSESAGAAGSVVRRVRDAAMNKVIEYTLNRSTNAISGVKIVQ
jgi:hypothetical protein